MANSSLSSPLDHPVGKLVLGLVMILGLIAFTTIRVEQAFASDSLAQVTPLDEEGEDADGLGVIVGTPDPGPEPEDAGDRGGFAQLGLAIVLFFAIGLIARRIILATRHANPTERDRP